MDDRPEEPLHLYDAAMRLWAESDLAEVAGWLDPAVRDPSATAWQQAAESLARLRLGRSSIDRIRKEILVNKEELKPLVDYYLTTDIGQEIEELGREKGLSEGRSEGRSGLVLALLRARFGVEAPVQVLAERLATWDDDAAAEVIARAENLADLTARAEANA